MKKTKTSLKGKTLLILGGGRFQVPLIEKAKDLHLMVIVVDRDENAPGSKIADRVIVSSITDVANILKQLDDTRIDAVTTDQTDAGVTTVAEIASRLGISGIGIETARKFTNKIFMRRVLSECGLPTPRFIVIKDIREADAFIGQTGFPLVLKPPSRQSSKGVFLIHSIEEFRSLFPITRKESTEGDVLLEEFIDGIEYTVESFVKGSRVYALAISEKEHLPYNSCVAIRLTYPPDNSGQVCPALVSMNERVIRALNLPFGITHAEYRMRDGIPYLIEIAARGGGTFIASDIVPELSGIDMYDLLIKQLFSLPSIIGKIENNAAILDFFQFEPGKIKKITGVEQSRQIPGVTKIELNVKPGDTIKRISDDTNRHGFFIARGKSREEVLAIAAKIKSEVKVCYE